LGQLFFNISALAGHLIAQSETPSPHKTGVNTDFDNLLKLSVVNEKICQQRGQIPDFDLLYSILSNVPAVALNMDQSEILPFNSYAKYEDYGINTVKPPGHMLNMGSPAELYSPESMTVSELKYLVTTQTVPLTLDLKKSGVQNDIFADKAPEDNPSDLPDLLKLNSGKTSDILNSNQIHNNDSLKALQSLNSIKGNIQERTLENLIKTDISPKAIQFSKGFLMFFPEYCL